MRRIPEAQGYKSFPNFQYAGQCRGLQSIDEDHPQLSSGNLSCDVVCTNGWPRLFRHSPKSRYSPVPFSHRLQIVVAVSSLRTRYIQPSTFVSRSFISMFVLVSASSVTFSPDEKSSTKVQPCSFFSKLALLFFHGRCSLVSKGQNWYSTNPWSYRITSRIVHQTSGFTKHDEPEPWLSTRKVQWIATNHPCFRLSWLFFMSASTMPCFWHSCSVNPSRSPWHLLG